MHDGKALADLEWLISLGDELGAVADEAALARAAARAVCRQLGAVGAACVTEREAGTVGLVERWGDEELATLRRIAREPWPDRRPSDLDPATLPAGIATTLARAGGGRLLAAPLSAGHAPAGVLAAIASNGGARTLALLELAARATGERLRALRPEAGAAAGGGPGGARPDRFSSADTHLIVNDRLAAIGTLAAGIGHEIANPLATVLLNNSALSSRLARAELPAGALAEAQRLIAENDEALDRIRLIIDELRRFVRKDDSAAMLLDVRGVVQSALRLARAPLRGLDLRLDLRPVGPVVGSAARLGQVFLNLLANAAQAASQHPGPRVEVQVAELGEEVHVTVRDNGPGIAPEHLEHIFETYFTTKGQEGTGLGLAIARDIVQRHGGRIEVEAPPGAGATFRVVLPINRGASGDAPRPDRALNPAVKPARRVRPRPARSILRRRLLVVDDEPAILRALSRDLEPDFDVVTAKGGEDAASACALEPAFDVLLCDVNLRGESGVDVAARLSSIDGRLGERVVFMTGGTLDARARATLEARPDRFVSKPFDLPSLLRVLREAAG